MSFAEAEAYYSDATADEYVSFRDGHVEDPGDPPDPQGLGFDPLGTSPLGGS